MDTLNYLIRHMDRQGRITIPAQYLKNLQWEPENAFYMFQDGNKVILQSLKNKCTFCGNEASRIYKGKPICDRCLRELVKLS